MFKKYSHEFIEKAIEGLKNNFEGLGLKGVMMAGSALQTSVISKRETKRAVLDFLTLAAQKLEKGKII